MTDRREEEPRTGDSSGKERVENLPGEPGRTPGKAEGDLETIEEALRKQQD